VTNRAIVVLAVAATACLILGARLLDAATTTTAVIAVMVLVVGTALAATAVAGAWRTPAQRPEPDSD
jgi:purine-cytosine permease-like protein